MFRNLLGCAIAVALFATAGNAAPLVGDGVADDTAAIQALIDSGAGCVYLPPPKNHYLISKTLKLGSNQELKLDSTTRIRLAPKSDCPMLENKSYAAGTGTNSFVTVTGGIWDMDNLRQSPNPMQTKGVQLPKKHDPNFFFGIALRFCHVEGLTVRGVTVRNPTTYGMEFGHVSNFRVDDITFDYKTWNPIPLNMDGVHFDGFCHHGKISNLRGTCFDDLVALNANDAVCSPEEGEIHDIDIDGIYADYCHSAVRLLSAPAPVSRITIRNVHGNFYVSAVWLTRPIFSHRPEEQCREEIDVFGVRPAEGRFDDIVISDVFAAKALPPKDVDVPFRREAGLVWVQGLSNVGNLVLERIYRDEKTLPAPTLRIDNSASVENLVIRDSRMSNRLREKIKFTDIRGLVRKTVQENTTFYGPWDLPKTEADRRLAANAAPRVILESERLDYQPWPRRRIDTLNSGWEMDGITFLRPFNKQAPGLVHYTAVFKFPEGVKVDLTFEDEYGKVLKSETIPGGKACPVNGLFRQDGSLARLRLAPSKAIEPKGVFVRPFRVTVDWAVDELFTCVPTGKLPAGWRGEKAKVVDLAYLHCDHGKDFPNTDAILEIAPGGFVEPCVDTDLLTRDYVFEFEVNFEKGTHPTFGGVDLVKLYDFTPGVWYHFRFEAKGELAQLRLNGRIVARDVLLRGFEIRNLSDKTLQMDDFKAYALVSPADYPPAPVRPKGEEKWEVLMNICSLWHNGHHAGWRCVERGGGPHPVLGYYDEGLPETADWEIKYMVEHGIDAQLFCWYPISNDGPLRHLRNEFQLRDGFKNARYSGSMKYALIWEISNAGRPHSIEAWKKNYVPYLIEHHFKDPRYYTVDGKALLAVFGAWNFKDKTCFGSPAKTKEAIAYLDGELRKIGFKGVYMLWNEFPDINEIAAHGFDAVCPYNLDINGWKIETQKVMNIRRTKCPGAFSLPTISIGYNSEAWHGRRSPMLTPADFETSLRWARDELIPSQAPKARTEWEKRAVLLSTWNEYGEGTYIMPSDDNRGFGYLDAVRAVFTDENPDPSLNLHPTAAQRARLCNLYPQTISEDGR